MNREILYKIAGVKQHAELEKYLQRILFEREERERFYKELAREIGGAALFEDTFKPYFEEYAAERKANKQDYTPSEVSELLSLIVRNDGDKLEQAEYTAYDPTAGTGSLLIQKWADDVLNSTFADYRPHDFFYFAEEYADNAIPYLLHNLAMRGMNCIVIHGDTLDRAAKSVYFVQNSKDDFMSFSDINVMPRTDEIARYFDIRKWVGPAKEHIESKEVYYRPRQNPLPHKATRSEGPSPEPYAKTYRPKIYLRDVATIERAQSKKVYPAESVIIQLSATRGQTGLLKSCGKVPTHYAVIQPKYGIPGALLFLACKRYSPHHFHRVQEGLNLTLEAIETIPLGDKDSYWGMYYQMHMPDGLSINKDNLDLLRQCQFVPEWYTDGICNALRDGVPRITVRW